LILFNILNDVDDDAAFGLIFLSGVLYKSGDFKIGEELSYLVILDIFLLLLLVDFFAGVFNVLLGEFWILVFLKFLIGVIGDLLCSLFVFGWSLWKKKKILKKKKKKKKKK